MINYIEESNFITRELVTKALKGALHDFQLNANLIGSNNDHLLKLFMIGINKWCENEEHVYEKTYAFLNYHKFQFYPRFGSLRRKFDVKYHKTLSGEK